MTVSNRKEKRPEGVASSGVGGFLTVHKALGPMARTENKLKEGGERREGERMNLEDITLSEKSRRQRGK